MAYNYNPFLNNAYYPYGNQYQPYQPQMAQRPQPQPTQPQAQFDTPIQDLRFVTSEEAKAFIVAPNTNALLIDRANKVAHLKSTDNLGQSSMRYFRFEEVDHEGKSLKGEPPVPTIDPAMFVKKEDLENIATKDDLKAFSTKEDLKTLYAKVDNLQRKIKITEMLEAENNGK